MIGPTGVVRVMVATQPVDFRKGADGLAALVARNAVRLAFCWSHVRRRFDELAKAGPAPIAVEALARITELYRVEGEIRGRPPDERRTVRQARSRPVVEALEPWLKAKLGLISQKSKLAKAIRYALARWVGLSRFLDDGRIERAALPHRRRS